MDSQDDQTQPRHDAAIAAAVKAMANTPLQGCIDDDGLPVFLWHIWPDKEGEASLERTLRALAQAALAAAEAAQAPRS